MTYLIIALTFTCTWWYKIILFALFALHSWISPVIVVNVNTISPSIVVNINTLSSPKVVNITCHSGEYQYNITHSIEYQYNIIIHKKPRYNILFTYLKSYRKNVGYSSKQKTLKIMKSKNSFEKYLIENVSV